MDEYISQLSWGGWGCFQFFLGDGNGLEAVQLLEQAAPLGGVQAVDEVARALRRVQRLHGLLLGVRAQPPGPARGRQRCQQPPPAAAPGRRRWPGRGGRAGPQAARAPAPEQRQQPGHGGRRSGGTPAAGRDGAKLDGAGSQPDPAPRSSCLAAEAPGTMHSPGPCGDRLLFRAPAPALLTRPRPLGPRGPGKNFLRGSRAGRAPGQGGRGGVRGAGGRLLAEGERRGRAGGLGEAGCLSV